MRSAEIRCAVAMEECGCAVRGGDGCLVTRRCGDDGATHGLVTTSVVVRLGRCGKVHIDGSLM